MQGFLRLVVEHEYLPKNSVLVGSGRILVYRYLQLGTVLFQQQDLKAAEKEFREALRVNPSADNHYSLAACLMSMDRYQDALSEIESATRLDPDRQLYRARREELLKLMKTNSR